MKKSKRINVVVTILLLFALSFITTGYALYGKLIEINGVTKVMPQGDIKITNVAYISGDNVAHTPTPTFTDDSIDFDLVFRSIDSTKNFNATYEITISNETFSDYLFASPSFNPTLSTSSGDDVPVVTYTLNGIEVGESIPSGTTKTFRVILSADYTESEDDFDLNGDFDVNVNESTTGSLLGSIYGTTEGDLRGDLDLAPFQISVINTYSTTKTFNINISSSHFTLTDANGNALGPQTINANTTTNYSFYVKKVPNTQFGSNAEIATITITDGEKTVSCGNIKLLVDKYEEYVDTDAPTISSVNATIQNTNGNVSVSWSGSDDVEVVSYTIEPYIKGSGDNYTRVDNKVTTVSATTTSTTFTGLSAGDYYFVVYGTDSSGNTATAEEISTASMSPGHASRSAISTYKWVFSVTTNITNASSNGASSANLGDTYTATISVGANYNLPDSLTVKMGTTTLNPSSDYSYSSSTGYLSIPNVNGDITITGEAERRACLIKGTLIKLSDGTTKPIEEVGYEDELLVWNYETGSISKAYPAWIERGNKTTDYQLNKFSDGSELKTLGYHGVFSADKNEFVSVDQPEDFHVGTTIYKIKDGKPTPITVTSIETVQEETFYYHVVSERYYNIIANDILTTDGTVILSNLYGFTNDLRWPEIRNQIISDPNNLYTYEDFADIMPKYMFDSLRVEEAKVLANYGLSLDIFRQYLLKNQLNPNMYLPPNNL